MGKDDMPARRFLSLLCAALWLATGPLAQAAARAVAVKLVFAVDASDSIEDWEWRLEMDGIASALRDKEVQAEIAALPTHAIAITLLVWGDPFGLHDSNGWRLIDSAAAANRAASEIARWPRRVGGGTAMGEGVAASLQLLEYAPFQADRQVIDVSGDGIEPISFFNDKVLFMADARKRARLSGVIINGLAIDKDWQEVFAWYLEHVATGSGSFAMRVTSMRDFAPAFRLKLLRELLPEVSERSREVRTMLATATDRP